MKNSIQWFQEALLLTLVEDLEEVHVTSLDGLGASYLIKGFFTLKSGSEEKICVDFDAVAFGGNYGGHNISVQLSDAATKDLIERSKHSRQEIDELISEVQRRMLNNEMIVEFEKLKPETSDEDPLKLGK
jgi:hypothetical protein